MPSHLRRTREGDATDARIFQQLFSYRAARSGHHFHGSLWQSLLLFPFAVSALLVLFHAEQGRERGGAGGLDNDCVPCRESRPELCPHQRQRKVPWHDPATDANRLAHHHAVGPLLRKRNMSATDFRGEAGVEFQAVEQVVDFQTGFEESLALFLGQSLSDLAAFLLDQLASVREHLAPVFGSRVRPFLKRLLCGIYRVLYVLGRPLWNLVHHLAGRGVANLVGLPADRIDRLSSN